MKIFIVYKGGFDCDKPRENMAEPGILLVTTDHTKARSAVAEELNLMRKWKRITITTLGDCFEWYDGSTERGKVGIIESEVAK